MFGTRFLADYRLTRADKVDLRAVARLATRFAATIVALLAAGAPRRSCTPTQARARSPPSQ
jgi:hypothetical protein